MINGLLISQLVSGLKTAGGSAEAKAPAGAGSGEFSALLGGMAAGEARADGAAAGTTVPVAAASDISQGMINALKSMSDDTAATLGSLDNKQLAALSAKIIQLLKDISPDRITALQAGMDLESAGLKAVSTDGRSSGLAEAVLLVRQSDLARLVGESAGEDGVVQIPAIVVTDNGEGSPLVSTALLSMDSESDGELSVELPAGFEKAAGNGKQGLAGLLASIVSSAAMLEQQGMDNGWQETMDNLAAVLGMKDTSQAAEESVDDSGAISSLVESLATRAESTGPEEKAGLAQLLRELVAGLSEALGLTEQGEDAAGDDNVNVNDATNDNESEKTNSGSASLSTEQVLSLLSSILGHSAARAAEKGDSDALGRIGQLLEKLENLDSLGRGERREVLLSLLRQARSFAGTVSEGDEKLVSDLDRLISSLRGRATGEASSAQDAKGDGAAARSQVVSAAAATSRQESSGSARQAPAATGNPAVTEQGDTYARPMNTTAGAEVNNAPNTQQSAAEAATVQRAAPSAGAEAAIARETIPASGAPAATAGDKPAEGSLVHRLAEAARDILSSTNETASQASDARPEFSIRRTMPQSAENTGAGRGETASAATAVKAGTSRGAENVLGGTANGTVDAENPATAGKAAQSGTAKTETAGTGSTGRAADDAARGHRPDRPAAEDRRAVVNILDSRETAKAGSADQAGTAGQKKVSGEASRVNVPVEIENFRAAASKASSGGSSGSGQAVQAYSSMGGGDSSGMRGQTGQGQSGDGNSQAQNLNTLINTLAGKAARAEEKIATSDTGDSGAGKVKSLDFAASVRTELSTASQRAQGGQEQQPRQPVLMNQAETFEKIINAARFTRAGGTSEISMKLEPDHLGMMRVRLSLDEAHNMTARIQVESHEARTMLESGLHRLRDSLADQGIKVEKFSVDVRQDGGSSHQQAHNASGRDSGWRPGGGNGSTTGGGNGAAGGGPDTAEQDDGTGKTTANKYSYSTLEWVA